MRGRSCNLHIRLFICAVYGPDNGRNTCRRALAGVTANSRWPIFAQARRTPKDESQGQPQAKAKQWPRARFCCKSSLREPLQAWPGPNKARSQAKDSKELGANRKLGAHPAPRLTRSEAGWEQAGSQASSGWTALSSANPRVFLSSAACSAIAIDMDRAKLSRVSSKRSGIRPDNLAHRPA